MIKMNVLLKLHERQCAILDLINRANTHKERFDLEYRKFKSQNNTWMYANVMAHTLQRKEVNEAIINRLTNVYIEVQKRINAMQPSIVLTETQAAHILQLTDNIS